MDILYILADANLQGGTEILTFNLMHALRVEGIDCQILSIKPYIGSNNYVISLSRDEYNHWNNKATTIFDKLSFCKESDKILTEILRKKFQEYKPTILVNQTYDIITALPIDLKVAQVFNWSIRGYENSIINKIRKKGLLGRCISLYINSGIKKRRHHMISKVPTLITLSNAASDELKSINKDVKNEQILIIPDPLTAHEDSQIRSSLKNRNIVFVGRLSHEKGVMRLLRIWKRISSHMPKYTLSIYGEGSVKTEMEAYIAEHRMERILFKGYCSYLEDIYTHADLLLMTSDTEGFGMVLIEAMYYGVPCVSFDCPVSPKEIISDAGVTVPCFDEEAYSNKVVELLTNRDMLHRFQHNAISRARDYYIEKVLRKWIELITETQKQESE